MSLVLPAPPSVSVSVSGAGLADEAHSGKLHALLKIVEQSRAQGEKTLVFMHSLRTMEYLERVLEAHGVRTAVFRGDVPLKRRMAIVSSVNKKPLSVPPKEGKGPAQVLLLTTKTGGLGLNLTGASRVVIFDNAFNPCDDVQAACRIFRLGQQRRMFIYRLLVAETIDERAYNMQVAKEALFQRAIDDRSTGRHLRREDYRLHQAPKKPQDTRADEPRWSASAPGRAQNPLLSGAADPHILSVRRHDELLEEAPEEDMSDADKDLARKELAEMTEAFRGQELLESRAGHPADRPRARAAAAPRLPTAGDGAFACVLLFAIILAHVLLLTPIDLCFSSRADEADGFLADSMWEWEAEAMGMQDLPPELRVGFNLFELDAPAGGGTPSSDESSSGAAGFVDLSDESDSEDGDEGDEVALPSRGTVSSGVVASQKELERVEAASSTAALTSNLVHIAAKRAARKRKAKIDKKLSEDTAAKRARVAEQERDDRQRREQERARRRRQDEEARARARRREEDERRRRRERDRLERRRRDEAHARAAANRRAQEAHRGPQRQAHPQLPMQPPPHFGHGQPQYGGPAWDPRQQPGGREWGPQGLPGRHWQAPQAPGWNTRGPSHQRQDWAPRPQGRPMHGSPPQGRPMHGSSSQGRPMHGSPPQGRPMHGSPPQGRPMHGSPPQGRPMRGRPGPQQGRSMRGPPRPPQQQPPAQGRPVVSLPAVSLPAPPPK